MKKKNKVDERELKKVKLKSQRKRECNVKKWEKMMRERARESIN